MAQQQPLYPQAYQQGYQQPQPYGQPGYAPAPAPVYGGPPQTHHHHHHQTVVVRSSDWSHGLCSCCHNCSNCCLGWFCPCVLFGLNQDKLNGRGCFLWGFLYFLGMIFGYLFAIILACIKRGELRQRYGIHGSSCGDCCTHFWCGCCAIIQEANQLEHSLAV